MLEAIENATGFPWWVVVFGGLFGLLVASPFAAEWLGLLAGLVVKGYRDVVNDKDKKA
jgi:hypothetical protein